MIKVYGIKDCMETAETGEKILSFNGHMFSLLFYWMKPDSLKYCHRASRLRTLLQVW